MGLLKKNPSDLNPVLNHANAIVSFAKRLFQQPHSQLFIDFPG